MLKYFIKGITYINPSGHRSCKCQQCISRNVKNRSSNIRVNHPILHNTIHCISNIINIWSSSIANIINNISQRDTTTYKIFLKNNLFIFNKSCRIICNQPPNQPQ